ncbi:LruC domain-containing protein [Cyclobacterium marinum]|uniref:LruC domain-containing protein n=1 Tax=Cyclobacterium marinum TaxID=104 RepID=UPI0011ED2E16|nr:LruC domain-containing protein [Cyclobacterium marinum]MBI0400261.1 LruC domain-containing protein [Cyclobacterium marinum]|tara:strand:+ start:222 stop:2252 length:2031 start_codon:yes stop_codon:yes gene_type:complete
MKINSLLLIPGLLALLSACNPTIDSPDPIITDGYLGIDLPTGFDFTTTKSVEFNLSAKSRDKEPIPFVVYKIYDDNPYKEGKLLHTVRLNEQGNATVSIDLPSFQEQVWVSTSFIGVEPIAVISIAGNQADYSYDATNPNILPDEFYESNESSNARMASTQEDFQTLGTWAGNGKPSYLLEPDKISNQLLKNINASLPERKDIRNSNPKALDEKYQRELFVNELAEVWVTYVHTGGSYRNTIGYYYYKKGEAPETAADIKNKTIIFPNAQSGVLSSGAKVKLEGPVDGAFEKDTYIGWFLISNGWQGNQITGGNGVFYADKDLNTFNGNEALRDQMVFLYDATEQLLLMGWEDIRRDFNNCDHDFNDVMFYASWNPVTSVDVDEYVPIDTEEKDYDEDGVTDDQDEYPEDSERAFNNFSPGVNIYGTLLFEDLWPSFGDYDLNDLVIDYNVIEVSNANNLIKEIELTSVVRATGAGYRNGFGFQLPISADQVESVEGVRLNTGKINTTANGLEQGQELATIIVMDDVNDQLPFLSNVTSGTPHQEEDTVVVKVVFKTAVRRAELGNAPYNPFMIINQDRGREVHLMNKQPTDLMDKGLFATGDDLSSTDDEKYFISKEGFNWALHIPKSIPYAQEKIDFTKAYPKFSDWAKSGGTSYLDWYLDMDGQINTESIYKK